MSTYYHITDAEQRRIARVDELLVFGAPSVPELVESLGDPSWTVRRAVVAALAALGDDAVPALCEWLVQARTTEQAIAGAVDALVGSLGTTANSAVEQLLAQRPEVAADAAQILGRRRAAVAVPALAAALNHADDNVAVAAIEALGRIGGRVAVQPLVELVRGGNFFRTFPAMQVLARTGDPRSVAPLAELLADEMYRTEAIVALGRTGSTYAIAPLAAQLAAADPATASTVARALADLLERAREAGTLEHAAAELTRLVTPYQQSLVALLGDADPEQRLAAASVLGYTGGASAMTALAGLIDGPTPPPVIVSALQRLVRLHEPALLAALASDDAVVVAALLPVTATRAAAPVLQQLLRHAQSEVRARACEALARIGDTTALAGLFALLDDENPRVTHAACAAIQSLGTSETATRVIDAIEHGSPRARRQALRIAGYLGIPEAYEKILSLANDPDDQVAELALLALGASAHPDALGAVEAAATSPRDKLRAAAVRAATVRGAGARALLLRALADRSGWVRYYACQGVGRIGDAADANALVERLNDEAPHVRIAALEALARLDGPVPWAALAARIESPDLEERRAVLASMGLRPHEDALGYLAAAATAEDLATRLIALSGLARRSEAMALKVLVDAARGGSPAERDAALSLLGERADRGAADALVQLVLEGHDEGARAALAQGGGSRLPAVVAHLAHADDREAAILATILARMGAVPALFEALKADNPAVRRAAVVALGELDARGAREAIGELAKSDPDPDVRRVCEASRS